MNQSEIAMKIAELILTQEELLYKWKHGNFRYGIYGMKQDSLEKIKAAVLNVTQVDIDQSCRKIEVVNARRVFAFLSYYTTADKTLVKIAALMGVKNHATAIHHKNKMKDLISINDYTSLKTLQEVCNKLGLKFIKTKELNHEN